VSKIKIATPAVDKSGRWQVYLLVNSRGRTYIGATTDVHRRIRQHRGEIRGGARSTRRDCTWKIHSYISGFENRSVAYRWEKLLKLRCKGRREREEGLICIFMGICPARNRKQKLYEVPTRLTLTYIGTGER
jgi:predicted GIY-YIG superfamily endonuclease